jgi:hypothetical protein
MAETSRSAASLSHKFIAEKANMFIAFMIVKLATSVSQ